MFYLEVQNELIFLEFTLPLLGMFHKSSTGGVWKSNGAAHYTVTSQHIHSQSEVKFTGDV